MHTFREVFSYDTIEKSNATNNLADFPSAVIAKEELFLLIKMQL